MKAEELRIGNLIEGADESYVEVISIAGHHIRDENEHTYLIEKIRPIPLTEEWLLKFGFDRVEGLDDMILWIKKTNERFPYLFDLCETENGYKLPSGGKICKYVHTLQNCYYFYSFQELKLKQDESI